LILDKIIEATKIRVAQEKQVESPEAVKAAALALPSDTGFPFEAALRQQDFNFICEVKKASPSKGIIAEHFPYLDIAKEYEMAGAAAISVLTEPDFFKGDKKYLQEIASTVKIPVLRKDFIIDEYQIYQAKVWGASAILLICACLDVPTLTKFRELADSLGLSSLVSWVFISLVSLSSHMMIQSRRQCRYQLLCSVFVHWHSLFICFQDSGVLLLRQLVRSHHLLTHRISTLLHRRYMLLIQIMMRVCVQLLQLVSLSWLTLQASDV